MERKKLGRMTTIHLIGGIALFCLGIAGIIETILDLRRWLAASGWPVAEGRVIYSHVEEQDEWHDEYTEKLKFKYEFNVDGQTYTGRRVRAGQELDLTLGMGPGSAWSTARHDAHNYPHGAHVLVRYDPRNPKRCCLQLGGLAGILVKLFFCVGLLVAGSVMLHRFFG